MKTPLNTIQPFIKHEPSGHSELGASGAKRWMTCPGSIKLSRGMPNVTSSFAAEGTVAHYVGEQCLLCGHQPEDYIGQEHDVEGFRFTVDAEMATAVRTYTDHVRQTGFKKRNAFVEQRLAMLPAADQLTHDPTALELAGKMFGTGDFLGWKPATSELHVMDYKHGSGVAVEVADNPQLQYYGLAALAMPDAPWANEVENVVVHVIQPRCPHPDGPVRTASYKRDELWTFGEELLSAASATETDSDRLVTGDHCRFCPAQAVCPKVKEESMSRAKLIFSDAANRIEPAVESPADLTDEELVTVLDSASTITSWINACQKYAHDRLERGDDAEYVRGHYKLVPKRASRRWKDEKAAAEDIGLSLGLELDDIYEPRKMYSPAKLDKALGKEAKELIAQHTESVSSGTTLAPVSDKREAIEKRKSAKDRF